MAFTSEEVEVLLQVAADATLGATFATRLDSVASAFSVLVPSSRVTAFVVDPATEVEPARGHAYFRNGEVEQLQLYATHYRKIDPMLPGVKMLGAPMTLSDFLSSSRAFGRDAFTGEFLPRFDIRHILGVSHRLPDGAVLSLAFHREKGLRDFTRKERELVRLATPYIGRAAYGALLRERMTALTTPQAGRSEPAAGGIIFGALGDLVHADPGALALAQRMDEASAFPSDALLAEVRSLAGPQGLEGQVIERSVPDRKGGLVRMRLSRVGSGGAVNVLAILELLPPGSPEYFELAARRAGLTPREREVAALAIQGLGNRAIGCRLRLSCITVGVALSRIYSKTCVQGRTELTALLLGGGKA